jgi:hypothetical protein
VPAPALPWLLTVARHVVSSQFRAAARQQSINAELRAWITEAELAAPDVADQVSERISVLTALAALPEPRWEHWTVRVAPPGSGAPRRQVQATALTVTFSGIGQPQRITAPRHAIQQFGRG